MAVEFSNTLSSYLEKSLINEENCLNLLKSINNAINNSDDAVIPVTFTNTGTNETLQYHIPSFGYLKKSIDRIDDTIGKLSGIDSKTNSFLIQSPDNEIKNIITTDISGEAPTIKKVNEINEFNFKSNWFFEDMLNPYLYVSLDLTNEISSDTERVLVKRYILKYNKTEEIKQNCSTYNDFINYIVNNKIRYILDEGVRELPPKHNLYHGVFKIIEVSEPTSNYYGNITKFYKLNKTTYYVVGDNTEHYLEPGDFVEINEYPSNAKYKVVGFNNDKIILELVSGVGKLNVGTELKISSKQKLNTVVEIPIGYDELNVIFIKPIDPHSNIAANNWSPAIIFYSNDLVSPNGHTLGHFYKRHVIDFGQVILSYAKDYYPSIREAITPYAPELKNDNFEIVNVNEQFYNFDKNQIRQLLQNKKEQFNEYKNRPNDIGLLEIYKSTISEIYNATKSFVKPEYKLRGFWKIPDSRVSDKTGPQEIISFKIQYKYLSSDKETETNTNIDVEGVDMSFSNWNEVLSTTRKRVLTNNDDYVWEELSIEDYFNNPNVIKINQCDIPIHGFENEKVVLRVKSISEAGYPTNPIESEWSNNIVFNITDIIGEDYDLYKSIEQNNLEYTILNCNL